MISSTVSSKPLVITECDFKRLRDLVQSRRYRTAHSADFKQELDRGQIVAPNEVPPAVVTMHSKVRVRDLAGNRAETYTLVYPHEADIEQQRLSVLAPLGRALLGTRTGQTIEVATPGGLRRVKVERILYQPEAAGDWHL